MSSGTITMQPAVPCAFDNEEFVDFESAHQYSITPDDWTLSELDAAALGIEQKTPGGGAKVKPEVKKPAPAVTSSPRSVGVMKGSMLDSDDDLFTSGSNRNYSHSFNKTRPTMISAKYRLKEERRKVLKISINKLKKIEDPESSLRRSVLINNTMKRLQKEARDERREKQQIHSFPRYTPSYKSFVLREEPPKPVDEQGDAPAPRLKPDADKENASPFPSERKLTKTSLDCFCDETIEELVDVTSLDDELSRPLEELANPENLLDAEGALRKRPYEEECSVQPLEALTSLLDAKAADRMAVDEDGDRKTPDADVRAGKKRSYDEVEDSEIHDVLSQFYMPPTPRMLTSIDDDEEEVNVVDIDIDTIEPEPSKLDSPLPLVTKVPDFEELVSEELDETKHPAFDDLLTTDLSLAKRPRFDSSSDTSVFCKFQTKDSPFANPLCDLKTSTYGFLSAESKRHDIDNNLVLRTEATRANSPGDDALCEIGSVNCGTVSTRRSTPDSDACAATLLSCSRGKEEDCSTTLTAREMRTVDRRSQITRISEAMSWTSKCVDSQEFKYNNGILGKTLTDCCYSNQETNNNNNNTNNNNNATTEQKYSCAHAAIFTELQSQVYHNFVTSLES